MGTRGRSPSLGRLRSAWAAGGSGGRDLPFRNPLVPRGSVNRKKLAFHPPRHPCPRPRPPRRCLAQFWTLDRLHPGFSQNSDPSWSVTVTGDRLSSMSRGPEWVHRARPARYTGDPMPVGPGVSLLAQEAPARPPRISPWEEDWPFLSGRAAVIFHSYFPDWLLIWGEGTV